MSVRTNEEISCRNETTNGPIPGGFLQWNHSCDSLVGLVRDRTCLKLFLDPRIVSIGTLEHEREYVYVKVKPGTVMTIDETHWQVAAADGVIRIKDFRDGIGQPITAKELAEQCHTVKGGQLPILTPEQAEQLAMLHARAMHAEIYWTQCLAEFEICQLPCVRKKSTQPPAWASTNYQTTSKITTAIEVIVAWLIYIARNTGMSHLQMGWDATEYTDASLPARTFAVTVPFGIFIDTNDTFSDVMDSVKGCYEQLINYLPCLSDTLYRCANSTANGLDGNKSWALAVSLVDTQSKSKHARTDANELLSNAHGTLMTLQINKQNGAFRWIFDDNQISRDEVNRISSRLLTLLASSNREENVRTPVVKLNLLPEAERDLLLYTWNQTTVTQLSVCCLHQLFEAQVECNGMAIAVEYEGETFSYSELNIQANRLAHHLISQGFKPDDRVALCVERSTTMIVAILGILKAGYAYVPLDPVYKSQRLTNILLDAEPVLLLFDTVGQKAIGEHKIPAMNLDDPLYSDLPIDNPDTTELGLTPAHLAYVIYTSGSTGTPKGVMVEHQQVVRLFEVTRDKFDFTNSDKWCLFHSFSFDVSVWEIWNAFYYGSHLTIVPNEITRLPNEFYAWICTRGITVLNQTPSAFKMLLQSRSCDTRHDRLLYIIFAGEELDPAIADNWNGKRGTIVVNMYGPTETLHATFYQVQASEKILSIGRPLPDLSMYLLDSQGEPVQLGAVGEIYISGAGVARGYLNRHEITAECFLPDTFRKDRVARMYRTGDLARYLPNGNLVFLGRMDQQVKIRGFRIELGEIEAQMIKHPNVHEAVVLSNGNASDAHLIAYVVADEDISLAHNLRTYLSALLPDYMVPVAYVCLPSLPLTPNGKLDRRSLPIPDDNAYARQQYAAPEGEMEVNLAQIWRELLSIDRIGRYDNFFALGGHSLLVPQLLAELRHIGLDTTASEVFLAETLSTLASTLCKYKAMDIPANLITEDTTEITPEMLPLITLSQTDIDSIVAQIPAGVANIQDIYGLTPLQSGMLYHHLMAREGDIYLLVSRLRFIDSSSLERYVDAMQQMAERHDVLRTAIFWDGLSEPAQIVLRQVPSPLIEVTLDQCNESALEQLTEKFTPHHFRLDLTQAPLLRLFAAQESDGRWLAVQLMHHAIVDHISLESLHTEMHAIMDRKIEILPRLTPFRQFVAQTRLGANTADHTRFFTEMLGDIDEPTFPFGLSDIGQGAEIDEAHLKLPQALNDQLRAHARSLQISLASICHLAWAQLLAKASGRESVVFGTMLLGRLQTGQVNNGAVGPMFNALPFRLNADDRSIEIAVRDSHNQLSALLAHEHASLALAQRCSGIPASLPLFSAMLNYRHNQTTEEVIMSIYGVSVIDFVERTNYPLFLSVEDDASSLGLTTQVILPFSAERICSYIEKSLKSLVDALSYSPQQPVRKLRVMPSDERTLLLHSWNQTIVTHSPARCLHQLFEAQVECNGMAIAVEYEGETFSYSELNIQANRLAHHLLAQGVKPDDRIALCVERSTAMIVAILGILKAGCAYVPLDPVYSSQRLTNILVDADPMFLLADATGHSTLGEHKIPVIELKNSSPFEFPVDNPDAIKLGLITSHLAYIIYTSGSTGTPKGVMVEHRQVVRLFEATRDVFDFNKQDKRCLFHSISFDVSVWEIWSALSHGGQLLIPPYKIARSTDEFYDWICTSGITVLNQTPSAFKMLMRVKNISSQSEYLRYIILAGEALDPTIVKEWYEKYDKSGTILVDMYGPTETVVYATFQRLEGTRDEYSIGRPLADLCVYLLNSCSEPVLLGAEGEISIGGAGVARGYLKRPELTIERFLPDPFSLNPASRLYRTGDLARYLPNGNLVFLGRIDQQVKIRGFRIEIGEIEACLIEHPQVREAVVQSYGSGTEARLVAYVVADSGKIPEPVQNLRTHLLNLLPDYMVPVAYVYLPFLPITPSGKLDRRALPAPNNEAFARQQYEAPQGVIEENLAQIWCKLLNIDLISRHDNFFALGGHSLLVVQLLAQLRQIGLDTTVKEIFDAPTLSTLASTVTRYKSFSVPPNLIMANSTEITPEMLPLIKLSQADIDTIIEQIPNGMANIQDIYGLTPLQNGILFHHLMAKEGDPYLTVCQLRFIDRPSLELYANALHILIERHDILRTAIFWDGLSEPAQIVLRQVPSPLIEVTLDQCNESALEQLNQKFHPHNYRLDLEQAPLLRLMVAPEPGESWVAVQLMHHLILDNLTIHELQKEIHAIMNGEIKMLTTLTPFRQFVAQTRLGANTADHTRFFTEMLGDIDEPTFPFGLSDMSQGTEINEAHLKLSQALNDQLRAHARSLQISLASICHLAWAHVLAKATGRESVVFGTVLLGRLQTGEGNNNIVGPMINTLPMRLNIDGKSVAIAVRDSHSQLSALLAHEHAPLVLAQRCSGIPANLPLLNSLLNYRHNRDTEEINISRHGISFLDSVGQSNYPLAMSIDDNDSTLCLEVHVVSSMPAARICTYMRQSLKSLIDALSYSPQQRICELSVMTPEERTLLLHSWNQTTVTHSPARCLHQLFEAQVECNGMAIAVEYEGETFSYSELNIQANRLAHHLLAEGVKPDDRVALCAERSTAMIVAILGILKAGCAYVPLDPVYSSQRLTNILVDADPMFLLADATGCSALGDHKIPVIELKKSSPFEFPIDSPDITKLRLTPAHLAYIIYTSGSTGTPKGVMVEHQQVVRVFSITHENFGINREDKCCLFHSISFDFSITEMWGAFHGGSQLLIVPYNIGRSVDDFYNWIYEHGITILCHTPSAFKLLMKVKSFSSRMDRLRYIMLSGEKLDPLIAMEWYKKYDKTETILIDMYGPTETTLYATFQRLGGTRDKYSIGRPLADLCVYLLNSCSEPVLLGAEGEISIGGAGVARGYLKRSELTIERFVPDPFSLNPASRLYRTGDLARYLPNGNLVFLGRIDQQVKIRGFRIEFGEIEAHLIKHPQVQEAVLQSYGNESNVRLVAYVVSDTDSSLVQNLRCFLSEFLPDYMVPAAFVCLSSLPLTPSGKLDRRALPPPNGEAFAHQQYEAPQGEVEEKLAQIWQQLLSTDRVSRHDNFFELGGHSLLVMHFVSNAKLCGIHIDARGVFSFPILKNLAKQITSQSSRFYCDDVIPVRQYGSEPPLFLVPDGAGDISYAFEIAHDIDKTIPIYVLPWLSPENKYPSSLEEMASEMIVRIKKIRPNGPCAISGYSGGGFLAFEIAKQLLNSGYPVSFLGLIDSFASLVYPLSKCEMFLIYLRMQFPIFKAFGDPLWWIRVSKLTINEAIQEIHKTSLDLTGIDIEWEVLLTKQRYNYQNMCDAYRAEPLPIRVHLFKALEYYSDNIINKSMDKVDELFNCPKLGWEDYSRLSDFQVIPADGDHLTMMKDPRNRSLLGRKLTQSLLQKTPE